jgi:hypothetical protein
MSIINDSHAIGIDTRNLVLKTRGTLHVKVGDRYYEIDFRNLNGSTENEDEKNKEKEEYIISVESKDEIDGIPYPGDNKLIVGLDGSIFVTKNNSVIDITPKKEIVSEEVQPENKQLEISSLNSASVEGKLYSSEGYSFDFANGEIVARKVSVSEEITIPHTMIKNRCCSTFKETGADNVEKVVRKYTDYDFVELTLVPDYLTVKSGVMIKSRLGAEIDVYISDKRKKLTFEAEGLYVLYTQSNDIIMTKLN